MVLVDDDEATADASRAGTAAARVKGFKSSAKRSSAAAARKAAEEMEAAAAPWLARQEGAGGTLKLAALHFDASRASSQDGAWRSQHLRRGHSPRLEAIEARPATTSQAVAALTTTTWLEPCPPSWTSRLALPENSCAEHVAFNYTLVTLADPIAGRFEWLPLPRAALGNFTGRWHMRSGISGAQIAKELVTKHTSRRSTSTSSRLDERRR